MHSDNRLDHKKLQLRPLKIIYWRALKFTILRHKCENKVILTLCKHEKQLTNHKKLDSPTLAGVFKFPNFRPWISVGRLWYCATCLSNKVYSAEQRSLRVKDNGVTNLFFFVQQNVIYLHWSTQTFNWCRAKLKVIFRTKEMKSVSTSFLFQLQMFWN